MRELRDTDPGIYRLITNRTEEARLWMTPSKNVAKLIGGIVARYQEIFGIVIYAYSFSSNHYHLLIRAPRGNTDEFEENVNREIARRINWKNQRLGKFWARRYTDQPVLEDEDLLGGFLYVTTNPVKHGLIRDMNQWPGLNSYQQSLDEQDRVFSFTEHSAVGGPRSIAHKLRLSPLPLFKGLSARERRKETAKLLLERTQTIAEERKQKGQGFLGLSKIRQQVAGAISLSISRSPRPCCYTASAQARREYRRLCRFRRERYDDASMRFRLGFLDIAFPPYCFKPPLHRKPRIIPFKPISIEDLPKCA